MTDPARLKQLRKLLWLYFWLLTFEGALRRWVFPGLSSQLLLVRDPIALLALLFGWPLLFHPKWCQWVQSVMLIGLIAFVLAITVGHGDVLTAAYGARILLLHLPLIFFYGAVFDRSDVIRFARVLAFLSIPMTLLLVLQSNLPSTHILNVAPGGEGTAVFGGALDRFRPPGVFSFTNGVTLFYTLSASALFALLYSHKLRLHERLIAIALGISLVVALPVSMSRGLLAGYLQVLLALIVALVLSRTKLSPIIAGFLALVLAIGIGSSIPAFKETTEAFNQRWQEASLVESADDGRFGGAIGVFQQRILSGFTLPLQNLGENPFLGHGIGISTNVGVQRLTGSLGFAVGEVPWEASLAEMGLPLGLAFLIWRTALGFWLLSLALRQALRLNRLPLIMLGSSLLLIISGQIAQPTSIGFIVLSAGLTLAACNPSYARVALKL